MALRSFDKIFLLLLEICCSGCVFYPRDINYQGPPARPQEILDYYAREGGEYRAEEKLIRQTSRYNIKRITLNSTKHGMAIIDFFQKKKSSDELILVFPILGGSNNIADYFAEYFARHGFDAAVIHRNGEFKDPSNFDRIEEVLRNNIIMDRLVIDFFEDTYQKEKFGAFGMSRGAINAAMTAAVDERLKYNVLIMGGVDLVSIFRDSNVGGVERYRNRVIAAKGFTSAEFYVQLKQNIKSDPKYLAQYLDAKHTLLVLSVFDQSVPIKYGLKLRKLIGRPDTIFLASTHYTSVGFTQFVALVPPSHELALFPPDYVETESMAFYNRSFKKRKANVAFKELPYRIIQLPVMLLRRLMQGLFDPAPRPRDDTALTPASVDSAVHPEDQKTYTAE